MGDNLGNHKREVHSGVAVKGLGLLVYVHHEPEQEVLNLANEYIKLSEEDGKLMKEPVNKLVEMDPEKQPEFQWVGRCAVEWEQNRNGTLSGTGPRSHQDRMNCILFLSC